MAFLNIKLDKIDFGEAIRFGSKVASGVTGNPLFAFGGNLVAGGGGQANAAKFDAMIEQAMVDSL